MLLGVLVLGWIFTGVAAIVRKLSEKLPAQYARRPVSGRLRHRANVAPAVANSAVIVTLAVLTFLWVGPLTGTGGQVEETFSSTVNSLTGKDTMGNDPATRPTASSEVQRLARKSGLEDYRNDTIHTTQKGRQNGTIIHCRRSRSTRSRL